MSIDCRTRRHLDRQSLSRDQIFDSLIMAGDIVEEVSVEKDRAARAKLTNVQGRIAGAGAGA